MKKKSAWFGVTGLLLTVALMGAFSQSGEDLFQKALRLERNEGKLMEAIELYNSVVAKEGNESLAAQAQLRIGLCYEKLGQKKVKQAQEAFQKVIDNFPEQTEAVKVAQEKLSVFLKAQALVEKGKKEFKMIKIPIDTENTSYAFISPDGKKLAYVGEYGEIWVRDIESIKDTRLTKTPIFNYWCFWSPDSKMIAYLDVSNGLHVVSVKGGTPKTLIKADSEFIKAGKYAWPVGWTSDSKMIICATPLSKSLVAIPLSGGEWKDIFKFSDTKQAEEVSWEAISPNGKLIAYESKISGNDDIYIMPVKGGESIQITSHPASDSIPTWSFDGKWLAFETTRSGNKEIWVVKIDTDGKPESELFRVAQGSTNPNASGTIYNWTKDGKIGISNSLSFSNIFIVDRESGKESQLTDILGRDERPRWSPDGTQIAFISGREGKRDIWILPSNGGEAKLITGNITSQGFQYISSPTWSPDGKNIAFTIWFGGVREDKGIWITPAEGGPVRKLKFDYDGSIRGIDWSPDGKKIAFSYYHGIDDKNPIPDSRIDLNDIYIIPVDGGEPTRITKVDKEELVFESPRWSPDGKQIGFASLDWAKYKKGKESDAICILNVQEGGEPKMIVKNLKASTWGLSWSPDGENIIFSMWDKDKPNTKGKLKLYIVSSKGGEIKSLDIEGSLPDFSPDGKKIAFSRATGSRTEFWVVENFLPKDKPKK